MKYLIILAMSFVLPAFASAADNQNSPLCRSQAIQVAAFTTGYNGATAALINPRVALNFTTFPDKSPESYGSEEWTVQYDYEAPVTIAFSVLGGECKIQKISVAGL